MPNNSLNVIAIPNLKSVVKTALLFSNTLSKI